MSNPIWYDTTTKSKGADLFEPEIDQQMPVLHKSEAPVSNEDIALLQAAQFAGPRDIAAMLAEAKKVGELLGEKAFYGWASGRNRVEGPTISLAYALAQVWGRCRTSVLLIEEKGSRVKLRGRYVDLLTVAVTERDYLSHLSDPPGRFADKPDQVERWRVMQLQSASSKAVRGAILGGLPTWLVDAALDAAKASATLKATGGRPLPEARQRAVDALESKGLTRKELQGFVGVPFDLWTAAELSDLRDLYKMLDSGEASVEGIRADLAGSEPAPAPVRTKSSNELSALGLGGAGVRASTTPAPSSPDGGSAAPSGGRQAEESKPVDPRVLEVEAIERDVGGVIVRKARGVVGIAPRTKVSRLGEKKREVYAKTLHELYADAMAPEVVEEPPAEPNPSMAGPADPLGEVLAFEESMAPGTIKRVRQDCGIDLKAPASQLSDEAFAHYHGALIDEQEMQIQADDMFAG